jgi:hypothetical protein
MWGYPYTLWLFVIVSIWFMANALITQPRPSLMAFVIVAAGAAAYRFWRKPAAAEVPSSLPFVRRGRSGEDNTR